jgi:hypothetical protein
MAREFYKKIILGLAGEKVSGIFRRVAAAAGLTGAGCEAGRQTKATADSLKGKRP